MPIRLSMIITTLLMSSNSYSLPTTVYRTPESRFYSGHSEQSSLQKNKVGVKEVWWNQVKLENGSTGWIPSSKLIFLKDFTTDREKGLSVRSNHKLKYALTKKDAIFYKNPEINSKVFFLMNENTQVEILNKKERWVKIKMGKLTGYILKDQVLLGDILLSKNKKNTKFALTALSNAKTWDSPSFQNSKSSTTESTQLVSLINLKLDIWQQSKVEPLGLVWWKSNANKKSKKSLSELFQRSIFDMATMNSPPFRTFVSAKGVFKSNEKGWDKISKFGDEDHPIAISQSGLIFVGPYFSEDNGESFKPYIQWPKLLKALHKKTLSGLKIQSIEIKDTIGNHLLIQTGLTKDKHLLYTRNRGKSWSLVK